MRNLTEGREARVIFEFTLPMLIGNVLQQVYNLTDAWVVGQWVGKEALAAVGQSFSIVFLLTALVIGVTMGPGIMIAQFFGARDMDRVRRTISTAYWYVLAASVVLAGLGMLLSRPLLALLRTPPEVLPQAITYLNIIFAGTLFSFGYNALSAVLRALGDSRTPLYFLAIAVSANVGLDLLFVIGFGLGVAGVAWATIISQSIAFAVSWIYMQHSRYRVLHIDPRRMPFDRALFAQGMRIGLPQGGQQTLVAAGFMALTWLVNGFGTDAIAAYTAAGRLDQFAGMPAMNFSMALTTFVGQNLGAGKPDRVRRGFHATLLMSGAFALVATLLMVFAKEPLVRIFNTDPGVVAIGSRYLLIVGSFYILFSTMFVTGAVPRGAGDTLIPFLITIVTLWIVRIPLSYWLSLRLGTDGIWWGIPAAWTMSVILSTAYYLSGRWRWRVVVRPAAAGLAAGASAVGGSPASSEAGGAPASSEAPAAPPEA
jgi:putative MATE family efflux protein